VRDLDMVHLSTSRLVSLEICLRSSRNFWRYWHIQRVANPKITVDIVLLYVLYQGGPRILLVLENLSTSLAMPIEGMPKMYLESLLSPKRLLKRSESAPLIRFAVASIPAGGTRAELSRFENHHALFRPCLLAVLCDQCPGHLSWSVGYPNSSRPIQSLTPDPIRTISASDGTSGVVR
jgi:hypothetical protein